MCRAKICRYVLRPNACRREPPHVRNKDAQNRSHSAPCGDGTKSWYAMPWRATPRCRRGADWLPWVEQLPRPRAPRSTGTGAHDTGHQGHRPSLFRAKASHRARFGQRCCAGTDDAERKARWHALARNGKSARDGPEHAAAGSVAISTGKLARAPTTAGARRSDRDVPASQSRTGPGAAHRYRGRHSNKPRHLRRLALRPLASWPSHSG